MSRTPPNNTNNPKYNTQHYNKHPKNKYTLPIYKKQPEQNIHPNKPYKKTNTKQKTQIQIFSL